MKTTEEENPWYSAAHQGLLRPQHFGLDGGEGHLAWTAHGSKWKRVARVRLIHVSTLCLLGAVGHFPSSHHVEHIEGGNNP